MYDLYDLYYFVFSLIIEITDQIHRYLANQGKQGIH